MIKGSIQQDVTIVNVYAHNPLVPGYLKRTFIVLQGNINSNTIIIRDFNNYFHQLTDKLEEKNSANLCYELN